MEIIDLSFINKLTILPKMELVGLQRIKAKTDRYCLSKIGSNAGDCDGNCDCLEYECNCDCERYDCEDCQDCRDCEDCDCQDYDCDDCLDCDCPVEADCDCADCVCNQYNCDCPDGDNCYDWDGCSDD
ncbi:MAG: hypothetical protein MR990_06330 [Mollicutes bacterium]|nr:hypothetical protein [Mollicutes bacterium]